MTKASKQDINLAITIFVAGLTIYSTYVVVNSFQRHRKEMEAKIDGLKKEIT